MRFLRKILNAYEEAIAERHFPHRLMSPLVCRASAFISHKEYILKSTWYMDVCFCCKLTNYMCNHFKVEVMLVLVSNDPAGCQNCERAMKLC